jgi:hypothetical protein
MERGDRPNGKRGQAGKRGRKNALFLKWGQGDFFEIIVKYGLTISLNHSTIKA